MVAWLAVCSAQSFEEVCVQTDLFAVHTCTKGCPLGWPRKGYSLHSESPSIQRVAWKSHCLQATGGRREGCARLETVRDVWGSACPPPFLEGTWVSSCENPGEKGLGFAGTMQRGTNDLILMSHLGGSDLIGLTYSYVWRSGRQAVSQSLTET